MELVKVWAIELFPGANLLYVRNLEEVAAMLVEEADDDNYEDGDTIEIKVREMTQEKYDNLPEWDGP